MVAKTLIAARVSFETGERFATVAQRLDVSKSVLLRRLVDSALSTAAMPEAPKLAAAQPVPISGKISVRLRPNDVSLLRERARSRHMPAGTYVAYLVRSHLRNQSPLPVQELKALRRSIAEVGALGRSLNQIARAVNRDEQTAGLDPESLQAMVKAIADLREQTKALVRANLLSWNIGDDQKSY
jgi:hypothetical protein